MSYLDVNKLVEHIRAEEIERIAKQHNQDITNVRFNPMDDRWEMEAWFDVPDPVHPNTMTRQRGIIPIDERSFNVGLVKKDRVTGNRFNVSIGADSITKNTTGTASTPLGKKSKTTKRKTRKINGISRKELDRYREGLEQARKLAFPEKEAKKPFDFKLFFQRLASVTRNVIESLRNDKWPDVRTAWLTPTSNTQKTSPSASAKAESAPSSTSSKTSSESSRGPEA